MQQGSSKCKVSVELSKATLRCKTLVSKKQLNYSASTSSQSSKRQPRKCDNPARLLITESSESILSCKNSACKAILSSEDKFCRKCSCCICHLFDDKKDPSLWLVCSSEPGDGDWCGLSCHIECALQHKRAGVVDLGQFMQLDGCYCCASCGKVSNIIGCWKKQLAVAKDAHQVNILCYRISLSYRLLNGTRSSKFKELHKIVEDAMGILETEVGPVNGVSARIVRGNVSRLSVVSEVQKRCSLAIMKAEECLNSVSGSIAKLRDYLPAACTFHFEEISSSSLVIVLNESCSSASDVIKGYKLCYGKSREEMLEKDPVLIPRAQQRILVPNLQPCTDYVFRIISFSDDGDLGLTESECFTRSVEIIDKDTKQTGMDGCSSNTMRASKNPNAGTSAFKVRNLGRIFGPTWAQEEGCSDELYEEDVEEESYIGRAEAKPNNAEEDRLKASFPRQLDLNVASVPDLDDLSPPMESSPEENGCTLEKSGLERSNGSGDCMTCAIRVVGEVPAVEYRPDCRKHLTNGLMDGCEGDSTLVSAPPLEFSFGSNHLDDNYEYCVKVIRWLECLGHIEKDFRMKFLTWFSFRSSEQERWVVITFIKTLIEEPSCLAGQLLDTFLEIVNCKRPRNGFCSKLWH